MSDDIDDDDPKCQTCGSDGDLKVCSNCDGWFCNKCCLSWVTRGQDEWGVTCDECVDKFVDRQGGEQ